LLGIGQNNTFQILYSDYYSGYWKTFIPAYFITNNRPIEPFFSPDSLYVFLTNYADIYRSTYGNQTWSSPDMLASPVNTNFEEYHPTTSLNGTLYFCSMRENVSGFIYRSIYENGNYSTAEKLGDVINRHNSGQDGAYDPFIAPDESYIIFSSIRSDGYGQADQYISYNRNSNWTNPKNLGPTINTSAIEYGSYLSSDGKYYFFSRPVGWGPNAAADIYWIKIDGLIDSLASTNFEPYVRNQIPDQNIFVGQLFNFTIPDSTFVDDDGNNTLTYSAKLTNGYPLPAWLSFDTITRTFEGIATIVQNLIIRVTAIDTAGAVASTTFEIVINPQTYINKIKRQDVRFFPNPTCGLINISSDIFSDKLALVEISNIEGKVILIDFFKNDKSIDLTSCPRGIYVMKLIFENEVITSKICLEKG
jgi:hypothetical protein